MPTATKSPARKAAAKNGKGRPHVNGQKKTGSIPTNDVRWVRLDLIDRDGQNHRLETPDSKRRIQELTNSFRAGFEAQLQPVRVYSQDGGRYLLGFGFRRCAAAELAGWEEIFAEIIPMPADRSEIERDRAIENLQRQDLNPLEELLAVQGYIDALGPEMYEKDDGPPVSVRGDDGRPCPDAIEYVAAKLGRSPAWVRDRLYLDRLGPKVRKMLLAGELLLGHAREIAKLGDHAVQYSLACDARVRDDGTCHRTIEDLRRWAEIHQRSLKIVPWKLDSDFADVKDKRICGACATCPHNSSNDRLLFEHDEGKPDDGLCLNDGCFEAKSAAVNKAVDKAVAKIVKRDIPITESLAVQVADEFVKPGRVVREAKKAQQAPAAEKSGKGEEAAPASKKKTPEEKAQEKLAAATEKWIAASNDAISTAVMSDHRRLIAMVLLENIVEMAWNLDDADVVEGGRYDEAFGLIAMPDGAGVQSLGKLLLEKKHLELSILGDLPEAAVDLIVKGWGLVLPPRPTLADFLKTAPESSGFNQPLHDSLHNTVGAKDRWAARRKSGGDDAQLKAWIGEEFGISGGGPGNSLAGGKDPKFWVGSAGRGKPTLSGKRLVEEVRRLLEIPMPGKSKPAAAGLEWQPGESEFQHVAANSAGIEEDADLPLEFVVELDHRSTTFKIDMSADALLPIKFPESFPTLAKAKAWCEDRNAELVAKGRDQMPELYEKQAGDDDLQRCRICGCTEENCQDCIDRTGNPCHWSEEDLCSACAGFPEAVQAAIEHVFPDFRQFAMAAWTIHTRAPDELADHNAIAAFDLYRADVPAADQEFILNDLAATAKGLDLPWGAAKKSAPATPKGKFQKIDDDVAEVIREATVVENTIRLQDGLNRKLYLRVDKAIKLLGGKWNKKAKTHDFPSAAAVAELMEGISAGKILDRKQTFQFFETPAPLAARMVQIAEIGPDMEVLEPSAGRGAIVRAILDAAPPELFLAMIDIDPQYKDHWADLVKGVPAQLIDGVDFLEYSGKNGIGTQYDRILMNPPFTGGQDIDHVRHAYDLLKPKGRLVAIMSSGAFDRSDAKAKSFQSWLDAEDGVYVAANEKLPRGTFKESGTDVAARLIVLDKPAVTKPAEFDEDAPIHLPKDFEASEKDLFAADVRSILTKPSSKAPTIKRMLMPPPGTDEKTSSIIGSVVIGESVVRGTDCLIVAPLIPLSDWPGGMSATVKPSQAVQHLAGGSAGGMMVMYKKSPVVIGKEQYHVRIGKGGAV